MMIIAVNVCISCFDVMENDC